MSTTWKRDTAPAIRPAGKEGPAHRESTADCLVVTDHPDRPQTPPEIKKFRMSARMEPGKTIIHPGKADDPRPPDIRFGKVERDEIHAQQLMRPAQKSTLEVMEQEEKEKIYRSKRLEPLGKTISRDYNLPEVAKDPSFMFGYSQPLGEIAKVSLQPEDDDSDEETEQLYLRTHHRYPPGQQKQRGYDWSGAGIDPKKFTFGAKESVPVTDGVLKSLQPHRDEESGLSSTKFVSLQQGKHVEATKDILGKTKNLGFGARGLDETYSFGKPSGGSRGGQRETVADCMRGTAELRDLDPPADLGRSRRRHKPVANDPIDADPHRSFGVPSVRSDIRPPKQKSVADGKNYGDDPSVRTLVFPSWVEEMGIAEDLLQPLDEQDLKSILRISLGWSEDRFTTVHEACKQTLGRELVCVHDMLEINNKME